LLNVDVLVPLEELGVIRTNDLERVSHDAFALETTGNAEPSVA
jgi:hypothetical protein